MGTAFRLRTLCIAGLFWVGLTCGGCRPEAQTNAPQTLVGWQPVGSFSGRGNSQTESFNIDSGQWRIKWATTNEKPAGAGTFRVTVHSAVSGRPMGVAVENRGQSHGVAYVNEDPRLYHLVIESTNVDWSVAMEEAVVGYGQTAK
jgi:hypothetical protein